MTKLCIIFAKQVLMRSNKVLTFKRSKTTS